jgi:lysophospholipase L1-like esterase
MPETPLLGLPLLEASQAQKHVTHNEALLSIDALTQLAVIARTLAAPPATPAEGDGYLVAASPTGAWAGHAGHIAYRSGGWRFAIPRAGWRLWVQAEQAFIVFNGTAWAPLGGGGVSDGDKGDIAVQGAMWTAKAVARAGHRLLSRLRANETSATLLILGDSLGYDTCESGASAILNPAQCFPRLAAQALAAAYPAFTVVHKTAGAQMPTPPISAYGAGNGGDGATVTVQTGTGANTFIVLDGSVPGTTPAWPLAARWKVMAETAEPDLVILNYGHNENDAQKFEQSLRVLIEELRKSWGQAPILLVAQNWGTNTPAQKKRNRLRVQQLAAERGCGLFDLGEVIEEAGGNASTALSGDGTHLSIAGQQIVAAALVARELAWNGRWSPLQAQASSFENAGAELLNDPFFLRPIDSAFKRGAWYFDSANLTSQRATAQWDHSAPADASTQTSLRLDGTAAAGEQELRQFIEVPQSWWGRFVTLSVRMYRPSSVAAANRGVIIINDASGQSESIAWPSYGAAAGQNAGTDGWVTLTATRQIASGTAFLIARIYAAPGNAAPASQMFVQWASMRLGRSPGLPAYLSHENAVTAAQRPVVFSDPVSGDTVTMANTEELRILRPAATIASLTLNLPPAPADRQHYTVATTNAISALTITATGGKLLMPGMPSSLPAGGAVSLYYNAAGTRWYAVQSNNASAIAAGLSAGKALAISSSLYLM